MKSVLFLKRNENYLKSKKDSGSLEKANFRSVQSSPFTVAVILNVIIVYEII